MIPTFLRLPLLAVTASVTISCGDAGPNISGIDPINISRVEVLPAVDTTYLSLPPLARLRLFQAVVYSRTGAVHEGAQVVWSSSDPEVAVVDANGVAIPRAVGTTRVIASAGKTGSAILVVLPGDPMPEPEPDPDPDPAPLP